MHKCIRPDVICFLPSVTLHHIYDYITTIADLHLTRSFLRGIGSGGRGTRGSCRGEVSVSSPLSPSSQSSEATQSAKAWTWNKWRGWVRYYTWRDFIAPISHQSSREDQPPDHQKVGTEVFPAAGRLRA